jgi:hypothetical protein
VLVSMIEGVRSLCGFERVGMQTKRNIILSRTFQCQLSYSVENFGWESQRWCKVRIGSFEALIDSRPPRTRTLGSTLACDVTDLGSCSTAIDYAIGLPLAHPLTLFSLQRYECTLKAPK